VRLFYIWLLLVITCGAVQFILIWENRFSLGQQINYYSFIAAFVERLFGVSIFGSWFYRGANSPFAVVLLIILLILIPYWKKFFSIKHMSTSTLIGFVLMCALTPAMGVFSRAELFTVHSFDSPLAASRYFLTSSFCIVLVIAISYSKLTQDYRVSFAFNWISILIALAIVIGNFFSYPNMEDAGSWQSELQTAKWICDTTDEVSVGVKIAPSGWEFKYSC
jgi:hypothetical protein